MIETDEPVFEPTMVPDPETAQEYDAMPAVAEYRLPTELAQVVSKPHGGGLLKVMRHDGRALTVTTAEPLMLFWQLVVAFVAVTV